MPFYVFLNDALTLILVPYIKALLGINSEDDINIEIDTEPTHPYYSVITVKTSIMPENIQEIRYIGWIIGAIVEKETNNVFVYTGFDLKKDVSEINYCFKLNNMPNIRGNPLTIKFLKDE